MTSTAWRMLFWLLVLLLITLLLWYVLHTFLPGPLGLALEST